VADLLRTLRGTPWVVYAKPPFGGPAQVLAYLGRYTHRIAIANRRLRVLRDGRVHFTWRDYADHDREKVMALPAEEFIRRFLLHILPDHFVRIRHFGLLANRRRARALARCRTLLGSSPPTPTPPPEPAPALRSTVEDLHRCPECHEGIMRLAARLAPGELPAFEDTS
jgi:hypothetical protein